jgi:SAM-dependent methyltransferase
VTHSRADYHGLDLSAMSHAANYHAWILGEIAPFLGDRIAEVGAGAGTISSLLAGQRPRQLLVVEPSPAMHARLLENVARTGNVLDVHHGVLADVAERYPAHFDSVLYINVLEHITDEAGELESAWRVLRPGGHLCIFAPALPWLYSDFDASVGHKRRYSRPALRGVVERGGFELIRLRYFDLAGVLPWLLFYRFGRRRLAAADVRAYDRLVVPLMRRVEPFLPNVIGKNLVAIGRKPGSG